MRLRRCVKFLGEGCIRVLIFLIGIGILFVDVRSGYRIIINVSEEALLYLKKMSILFFKIKLSMRIWTD